MAVLAIVYLVVKATCPAIAAYCSTINACAIATLLPFIVVPIVSAFTKKVDSKRIDFIFDRNMDIIGEENIPS